MFIFQFPSILHPATFYNSNGRISFSISQLYLFTLGFQQTPKPSSCLSALPRFSSHHLLRWHSFTFPRQKSLTESVTIHIFSSRESGFCHQSEKIFASSTLIYRVPGIPSGFPSLYSSNPELKITYHQERTLSVNKSFSHFSQTTSSSGRSLSLFNSGSFSRSSLFITGLSNA